MGSCSSKHHVVPRIPYIRAPMRDALQALLREASDAPRAADFWRAAAGIVSRWAGGARLTVAYKGLNESGNVAAGTDDRSGRSISAAWRDADGRHVEATLAGAPPSLPAAELEAAIEYASRLAVMVGRRPALERERRLGSFVIELARWLLAAPETHLLLRYTLESLMELVEAQGAFVALKEPDGQNLRVSPALGEAATVNGLVLAMEASTTGRVVRTGEPVLTDDLRTDADTAGTVRQVNEAAVQVFGVESKETAIGRHLEKLGLSPSGLTVRLMLAGRQEGQPWHGRVLITQRSGERRICDCTVTDLRGLGSHDLLVALYDRTDELRAQRELIAREKLATVREIACGRPPEV